MSCSWDKTIRVWNAWKKQAKKKEVDDSTDGKSDKLKNVEILTEGEQADWEEEGEEEEGQEDAGEGDQKGEEVVGEAQSGKWSICAIFCVI